MGPAGAFRNNPDPEGFSVCQSDSPKRVATGDKLSRPTMLPNRKKGDRLLCSRPIRVRNLTTQD